MRKPHQDILMKLLHEIDEACALAGIPYACVDRLAWQAYKFHEFRDGTFDAYIAISAEDEDRLRQLLSAREDRDFEEYRRRGMRILRYIDKQTFYRDLRDTRRLSKPGIAIDIRILDFNGAGHAAYWFGARKLMVSRESFFPAKRYEFEGMSLPIPANYDDFFTKIVGKDWRTSSYKGIIRKDDLEALCDITLPYEQALELPQLRKTLKLNRFKHRPLFNELQKKRSPVEKKAFQYRKARSFSARRFFHWEQLYPRKEEIAALLSAGSYEELENLLDSYLKDLHEYAKKWNYGMYLDHDIFEASKPIIIQRYGLEFFEKYDKAIPDGHRKDIDVYLRENGIDHPLLKQDQA